MYENERRWYVIHTYSGQEQRVKDSIDQKVDAMKLHDKIFNVIVPEIKDRKNKSQKVFPGYVIIEMMLDDDIWFEIKSTTGVTGFIGSGKDAVPLSEREVVNILGDMGVGTRIEDDIQWDIGQKVKVIDGPFNSFVGEVKGINKEKKTVQVMLKIFGRETSVEVQFTQIEEVR